jgi:hypothetical protein
MKNQSKINGIIRTIILSFGIIALSFSIGCKKKTDDTPKPTPTPQTCKISKIILRRIWNLNISDTTIVDIVYDSDFKIISKSMLSVGATVPGLTIYTYSPNKITVQHDVNSSLSPFGDVFTEYLLDSSGNVQTEIFHDDYTLAYHYEYNEENYLTSITSNNDTTIFTYENGNLIRQTTTQHLNNITRTIEYGYEGGLTATSFFDINGGICSYFIPHGKNSNNLATSYNTNDNNYTTNYSYTLDDDGKITKVIAQQNNYQEIYDFSYTCR